MPQKAIQWARKMLPKAGRPDMAATAAVLRQLEQQGALASSAHHLKLDASQMHAISTALLNPLTLLHGPPGTGKTTTIGGLLYCLRCV
jgi:DNA polymerase III delta prime subunit